MADQEINEKDYYSVTWIINNFSYCWQKQYEAIASPTFSIYIPEETKWKLLLFPRGSTKGNGIGYFLYRGKDCNSAEKMEVKYELGALMADGSILKHVETKTIFCKDSHWGYPEFLNKEIVLKKSRMKYLPQDSLTVRCIIKRLDGKPVEIRQIFTQTTINVEKKSLLWSIKEFSNLTPNVKKQLIIKSASNDVLITIDFSLSGGQCFEEKINLNIYPSNKGMKFFALQTSLLKSDKTTVDSGKYEDFCEYGRSSTFPLTISRNKVIERSDLYLPNDVLFLKLEFAISTGFSFEGVTKIDFGTLSSETTNEVVENWRKCSVEETVTKTSSDLITDLMSLYKDQILCDAKLQTKTDAFPAHISILSARSPVFRAMFATDMKEKMNGLVDVSDFDDKTIRQLLLFLYTNKVEELNLDDALQLYQIADKYEIITLKRRCSLFLKDNLKVKNSCQILILSDLHQDEDLKNIAQAFILKNAKEIFKSDEWKVLKDANSKLALETALRNWDEE